MTIEVDIATKKGGEMKSGIIVKLAEPSDQMEELRKLLNQLRALTTMVSGEGAENFCLHNDEIKNAYIMAMSDAVDRALALTERVVAQGG